MYMFHDFVYWMHRQASVGFMRTCVISGLAILLCVCVCVCMSQCVSLLLAMFIYACGVGHYYQSKTYSD